MEKPTLWTKNFIFVSISNFFVFMTFYYLLVILPIFALDHLNASEAGAGALVTVFLISAILSRPLTGKWINQFGLKNMAIISLLIFGIGTIFYLFSNSMISFLILRFFHGIGFGMVTTVAGTIVANVIPASRRGEGMGYFALFMNLAMVIGPFMGLTVLKDWGVNTTFTISVISAFLALIIGLLIKLPKQEVKEEVQKVKMNFRTRDMIEPSAVKISIVAAFFAIAYSSILSFVSVYATQIGLSEVSSFFFVIYALVLLLSRPFTGRWFDRYGPNVIIYPALLCFAVGMYVLSGVESAFIFLLAAGLIGIGWGTVFPSLQTIAIQKAEPKRRGLATSTFLSIFDIGMGVGSFFVGIIGGAIGLNSLYFYSSFFILIGIGLYFLLHGNTVRQVSVSTSDLPS